LARYAPAVLVTALLAASALAFALTESLKLTPSPILGTRVAPKVFSPTCRCVTDHVDVSFRLRKADTLDVDIVRGKDTIVRTLVGDRRYPRGPAVFTWDGRDDTGAVVPEGVYRPRVRLLGQHRTILLPNPIRVDTSSPRVTLLALAPRVFSPDGDRRRDRVIARFEVDEPSRIALFVDGVRAVRKRGTYTSGRIDWYGTVNGAALPQGAYAIQLGALDVAGNPSPRTPAQNVLIRYIVLAGIASPRSSGAGSRSSC